MKILFIIKSRKEHMKDRYSDDLLMAEHLARGHAVWVSEPIDLVYQKKQLFIHAFRYQRLESCVEFNSPQLWAVSDFDFIYFRAMPPVEKNMLFATYLMENIHVPMCNSPRAIRNLNEKINALPFAAFMPPTLITATISDILAFAEQVGWPIVIKPLDVYQAKGVVKVDAANILEEPTQLIMAQPYLKEVEITGSKRVFILNGRFIGAISFRTDPGDFRTNFGRVPSTAPATLSVKEEQACHQIGKHLITEGVTLAALDFIDEYLMEINITCPGGFPQYNEQYGIKLETVIVDGLMLPLENI